MHWRQYQEMQKVVEIGDRFLSYLDVGSGPALVLLHGFPTWGYLFHRLVPVLERRNRVIVPDLAGYGFSDRSDRFDRSTARQAERVSALLQAIGVDRASFVGHDMGAAVALRVAAQHPERVDHLCLMEAAAYDCWPAAAFHELGHPSVARRLPAAALQKRLAKALEPAFVHPEPELTAGLLAPYATEVGKLSLIRDAAALDCGETMELAPLLPGMQTPTLVLWGESDPFQSLSCGRRLAWDLPRARLSLIPDASHFAVLDRPAEVAAELVRFLESPVDAPAARSPA